MDNSKFPEYDLSYIDSVFSLRKPQYEALEILDRIVNETNILSLNKEATNEELQDLLKTINRFYPTITDFERAFPSLCFALATGVGKTRLMATFITYLYTNYGIENYFVLAPNLTIYNKLIDDFTDSSSEKYVFKGVDCFLTDTPKIITGDTYREENTKQTALNTSININIFNIGKINSTTNEKKKNSSKKNKNKSKIPMIKRLSEYLSGLKDLVLIMDESHHYRADKSMSVINDLKPLLGLELTATPQVIKGTKTNKFKNVVYEYSLSKAMTDGFVKEPWVATRENFNPKEYSILELDKLKLIDGLKLHRKTKNDLKIYAKTNDEKLVKPFVLVVCRDTEHSKDIIEYIKSNEFFHGEYKNKVVEVHSSKSKKEKDDNINILLNLENENNEYEIVVHVNMLKEGWDVTNLYTIIPLRTATSETLREQTIGRGLRLPYGKHVDDENVNRLTIISHDKFAEIVEAANHESSLFKEENIIKVEDLEDLEDMQEVVVNKTKMEEFVEQQIEEYTFFQNTSEEKEDKSPTREVNKKEILTSLANAVEETVHKKPKVSDNNFSFMPFKSETKKEEVKLDKSEDIKSNNDVKEKIIEKAVNSYIAKNNQMSFLDDTSKEEITKQIEKLYNPYVEEVLKYTIDIPDIIMKPIGGINYRYVDFDLDTKNLNQRPVSENLVAENLKNNKHEKIKLEDDVLSNDNLEKLIVGEVVNYPEVNLRLCSDLLYSLARQCRQHFSRSFSEKEVTNIITYHKKSIGGEIYSQLINEKHFKVEPPKYEVVIANPMVEILSHKYSKSTRDEELDFHNTNHDDKSIRKKIFTGFKKACHTKYKFDSKPEQLFAIIIDREDNNVIKWLRPTEKQFKLWWKAGSRYEPDFVVETDEKIYIVEVKSEKEKETEEVKLKYQSARKYIDNINSIRDGVKRKEWDYMFLIAEDISLQLDFKYIESNYI